MRIVVIGLGAMGQNHVRILSKMGALYGVYDTNRDLCLRTADHYDVIPFYSFETLLQNEEFNSVSIVAPTPLHKDIAVACLNNRLHVFLEKPIADSLEAAKEIAQTAKTSGKILGLGYIERYNPAVVALSQLVKNNFFGQITAINVKRVGGIPRSANNIILDLMTHDINILISLFGKTPNVINGVRLTHDNIVDSAQILFDFDGASATCESNWISPIKVRRIEITGTEGYAVVDLIAQTVTEIKKDYETTRKYFGEPLSNELLAFQNAVDTGITTDLVSAEDAIATLEVTLKALE